MGWLGRSSRLRLRLSCGLPRPRPAGSRPTSQPETAAPPWRRTGEPGATSATAGRRRLPRSTESAATALRHRAIGGEARAAVARFPARGAAVESGRSPTPVMASACPAAPCPERVRCTASAPVDNAADLMDARKPPPPHRDTAPTTGPRSEPAQWAVAPASAAAVSRRSSPTTSACEPRVMYLRRRLPSCQPTFTTPRQRPSDNR
jgi:hypothetical protein